MNEDEQFSLEK